MVYIPANKDHDISQTKKITLFASVFCGTLLLLADVNFVLERKLRLRRRSHVLLSEHLADASSAGRFVDFITLSPIDHREDAGDKKNIYIYT